MVGKVVTIVFVNWVLNGVKWEEVMAWDLREKGVGAQAKKKRKKES